MAKEEYVKVRVILVGRFARAIGCVKANNDLNSKVFFIPLSLIHGADEPKISNAQATEVISFRLMEWKAEELDL